MQIVINWFTLSHEVRKYNAILKYILREGFGRRRRIHNVIKEGIKKEIIGNLIGLNAFSPSPSVVRCIKEKIMIEGGFLVDATENLVPGSIILESIIFHSRLIYCSVLNFSTFISLIKVINRIFFFYSKTLKANREAI